MRVFLSKLLTNPFSLAVLDRSERGKEKMRKVKGGLERREKVASELFCYALDLN